MVEILHIIKSSSDSIALDVVKVHVKVHEVAVLLIQDGVLGAGLVDTDVKLYASKADVEARSIGVDADLLDYGEIVDLIFGSEKVICW